MKLFKNLIAIFTCLLSLNSFAEVSVIVNTANNDTIDATLVKKIYLGKAKSFPSGGKVNVFTLSSNMPETEHFRKNALNKSNSQFKSYWSKLTFTGKGTPAKELSSPAEIINAVKNDPNAIGFINTNDLNSDVKALVNF
jgi:ABC-type phosphate transport system substrate-binding protein